MADWAAWREADGLEGAQDSEAAGDGLWHEGIAACGNVEESQGFGTSCTVHPAGRPPVRAQSPRGLCMKNWGIRLNAFEFANLGMNEPKQIVAC